MELFALAVILFEICLLYTVVTLLLDNRSPAQTMAWILVLILFPFFGFIVYLLLGRNWQKTYNRTIKLPQSIAKNLVALFKPLIDLQEETLKSFKDRTTIYHDDLMTLLYRNSNALLTLNNELTVFHNGKDKFDSLLKDIEGAKKFIHIEYFIWYSKDKLGQKMKELLIKKAREGVEIKILYDFSGCLGLLSPLYVHELRKEKILIYPFFNYLANFKLHTLNYRNHRKIVVIDGHIGYTGGMNIGQEYIDGGKKYKSWRDTHIRLVGESASVLEAIFAIDWFNTVNKDDIFDVKYYPIFAEKDSGEFKPKGNVALQLTTSGHDSPWPSILHLYFTMITMAQKNIYIVSPYFIPEESLLVALKVAAMRGIKVVVMMTGVPDNRIPFWAAFSYFEELLKAGVQIFQYQKGFMHAKMFSIDGRISSIGSANFDIRSLKLNYEINAVFYDEKVTKDIDEQIQIDLKSCKEIKLEDLKQTSVIEHLRNSLVRLLSGLL